MPNFGKRKAVHIFEWETGFDRLRLEIVNMAIEDYIYALNGKILLDKREIEPEEMSANCERFFRSSWFKKLFDLDVDGEDIIRKLREIAVKERFTKRRRIHECAESIV